MRMMLTMLDLMSHSTPPRLPQPKSLGNISPAATPGTFRNPSLSCPSLFLCFVFGAHHRSHSERHCINKPRKKKQKNDKFWQLAQYKDSVCQQGLAAWKSPGSLLKPAPIHSGAFHPSFQLSGKTSPVICLLMVSFFGMLEIS